MEAPEEVRARATLAAMQARIAQGPYAALGIPENATAEEVRSAFLQLTKQFHPARFGRMVVEIQRLSNEVFLGIKAAHDMLAKALGGSRRASLQSSQSGGMPVVQPEGSGKTTQARPTGSIPAQSRPAAPPARPSTPPNFARGTDRPASSATERPSAPTIPRTLTPVQAARTTTPPLGTPVQRPATPPARPTTPTGARPVTPPARPPTATSALNPDTVRGVAAPREPAFDERAAVRESLMLLNDQDWSGARQVLSTLATKVPQSKNYRALLAVARGREAQAAGRLDEALLEFQRALQIDPDQALAKQALADVQRRR